MTAVVAMWQTAKNGAVIRLLGGVTAPALATVEQRLAVVEAEEAANHTHPADYDSNWFNLRPEGCRTYKKEVGFDGLPRGMMAYYKIGEGAGERIFAWGHLNSANNVSNGALLDFDGNGVLYVRLPCGHSRGNHAFLAGYYTTRDGDGNVQVYGRDNVQMRVLLWK